MKRKNFIMTGLLAVPALSLGKILDFKVFHRASKGIFIKANESRFYGEQKTISNELLRCVVSNKDADGQLLMGTTLPSSLKYKGGPPLHVHKLQDEVFFVVSGEFLIQMDKEIFMAKAGDAAFIPRGTPHTFANPHENNPGSLISIHVPGSDAMEAYFKTIASGNFPQETSADLSDVGSPIDIDAYYKNVKP